MDNSTAEEDSMSELQCDSNLEIDDLWECDTSPNMKGRINAPTYTNNFTTVLQEPGTKVVINKNQPSRNSCFNCLGQHLISECPEPRDQRAITKNRREFMNKNAGFFRQVSRYHLGEDQMYAHMIPGQISKSLRQALGLSDKQLPLHIYRMRSFGYPPGWLEDARISRSGIALYVDSKGNEIPTPGDEEGEIINDGSKDRYDITKIHDFPGFNISPEPGTIDESRVYQCPAQQYDHTKEAMIKNLEVQSATSSSYKKLSSIPLLSKTEDSTTDCENDPNSVSTPDTPFQKQTTTREERGPSPSLEDLEAQKQSLMAELLSKASAAELVSNSNNMVVESSEPGAAFLEQNDEDSLSVSRDVPLLTNDDTNKPSSGSADVRSPRTSVERDCVSNSESNAETPNRVGNDQPCTPRNSGSVRHVGVGSSSSDRGTPYNRTPTSQTTKIGTVKQIDQGTPILKSASPYSSLPSPANFSKDICDVINFENLPDALGHYKRMNEVIHTVRDRLKKKQ